METMYTLNYDSFDEDRDFDFQVSKKETMSALAELLYKDYFSSKEHYGETSFYSSILIGIEKFIDDFDLTDDLFDNYKEELKQHFHDEAKDQYKFWRSL